MSAIHSCQWSSVNPQLWSAPVLGQRHRWAIRDCLRVASEPDLLPEPLHRSQPRIPLRHQVARRRSDRRMPKVVLHDLDRYPAVPRVGLELDPLLERRVIEQAYASAQLRAEGLEQSRASRPRNIDR